MISSALNDDILSCCDFSASSILYQLVNSSIRGRRHDLTEMQATMLIEQGYRSGIATSPDPLYVPRNIAASQPVD